LTSTNSKTNGPSKLTPNRSRACQLFWEHH
jgi:hypothetical protein